MSWTIGYLLIRTLLLSVIVLFIWEAHRKSRLLHTVGIVLLLLLLLYWGVSSVVPFWISIFLSAPLAGGIALLISGWRQKSPSGLIGGILCRCLFVLFVWYTNWMVWSFA